MTPYQVAAAELVSGQRPVAWPFGKNAMKMLRAPHAESPGASAGAFDIRESASLGQ
jgi:hypothetical protein